MQKKITDFEHPTYYLILMDIFDYPNAERKYKYLFLGSLTSIKQTWLKMAKLALC